MTACADAAVGTGPAASLARRRVLALVAILSALFAFYVPSSLNGEISRALSMVSLAGTFGLMATLLALAGRTASLLHSAIALAMPALLLAFTLTSPFSDYSPGVILLYGTLALLFLLDLRGFASSAVDAAFYGISVLCLVHGYALAMDVTAADAFTMRWYSAFYRELLSNMVVVFNKPVLAFATHSMAGYVIYVLFYMHLLGWQARGGTWRLAFAVGFWGLLPLLGSTTGTVFAGIAAAQLAWGVGGGLVRRHPLVAAAAGAAALAIALVAVDTSGVYARIESAIVGDRIRGLASRYATDGLLARNFTYLSDSPFSPIGFGFTESLYLGDSGIVVNLLRGSVPLVGLVYGGLWLFLRTNLADRRAALGLWTATVLFEIGFTPLQYFRFLGFLPLAMLYLQGLEGGGGRAVGAPSPIR